MNKVLLFSISLLSFVQTIFGDFQVNSITGVSPSTISVSQGSGQQPWNNIQQFLAG